MVKIKTNILIMTMMVLCMSLNAQTPFKDWVYEWFHPNNHHCSGYPGPDSGVIGLPIGPPGHEPLTNQTYTIIDVTIGGNPCVNTSVIQNPDSIGIDNKPYLNNAEITYINSICNHSNIQFDWKNKKIAFIIGSDGQGIISKIDFFKKCFGDSIGSNRKPHVTLEVLNEKEKKESGGYDVLLKYKVFPLTYKLKRKVLRKLKNTELYTTNITFRDTIFNIAFDSISCNLGNIVPTNKNNRLVKHFKYIGKEPIYIKRVWTGDPHFICEYPKEKLIPNKIYSFTVCFWHQNKQGTMSKFMGFDLSDGNKISFKFTGTYILLIKKEK